jgi:RNA polymerase sigma factor (sigma-70 family)
VRQYKTRKRTSNREVSIEADDAQAEQIADSADTPRTAAAASEERARVQTALERLTPRYREILIERTFQRLTFAEIGKQRGCSADAARKLWGRAVARLQEALRGIP